MNLYEKFIDFLSYPMPNQQAPFMPFHFIMLGLTILASVLLCIKLKDCSERTFRKTLFVIWVILFAFEVYKQMVAPFSKIDGKAVFEYDLNDIPYQFCSSIHYTLLPIVFLKEGKIRDAIIAFTMTFVFLAGLVVSIYPDQLKSDSVLGICIQTMVHHGLQVVTGAFIAVRMRKKYSVKFFLSGTIVFVAFLIVALIFNLTLNPAVINGKTINFFYISPYHNCPLPILGDIRKALPWALFFIIYVIGFVLASLLIALIFYVSFGRNKTKTKENLN